MRWDGPNRQERADASAPYPPNKPINHRALMASSFSSRRCTTSWPISWYLSCHGRSLHSKVSRNLHRRGVRQGEAGRSLEAKPPTHTHTYTRVAVTKMKRRQTQAKPCSFFFTTLPPPVRLGHHLPAVPGQRVQVAALQRLLHVEEDHRAVLEHHQRRAYHGLFWIGGCTGVSHVFGPRQPLLHSPQSRQHARAPGPRHCPPAPRAPARCRPRSCTPGG